MKRSIMIICAFCMFAQLTYSQEENKVSRPEFVDFMEPSTLGKVYYSFYLPDGNKFVTGSVIGTPYLEEEWNDGELNLDDGTKVDNYKLRYNVYTDEMEFQLKGNPWIITYPEKLVNVILDGKEYRYYDYFDRKDKKHGYFEIVLENEKVKVLRKNVCSYLEATYNPTLAAGSQNAKFSHSQEIFVKKEGKPAMIHKGNKKKLLKYLEDHQEQLSQYIKDNSLNLNNERDLASLMTYYKTI